MANPKSLPFDKVAAMQEKAVEFLRNIGNDDLADEIDNLTVEQYASRKGIVITDANPARKGGDSHMERRPTRAELEEENEELWGKLESVYDDLGDLFEEEDEEEPEDESEQS